MYPTKVYSKIYSTADRDFKFLRHVNNMLYFFVRQRKNKIDIFHRIGVLNNLNDARTLFKR